MLNVFINKSRNSYFLLISFSYMNFIEEYKELNFFKNHSYNLTETHNQGRNIFCVRFHLRQILIQ